MDNIWQDRFFAKSAAWHGKGVVMPQGATAVEACKIARLDYVVSTKPLLVDMGGVIVPMGDRVAIVRDPVPEDDQYRIYGVASKDYTVLQNTDIAAMLEPLTKVWPVETMGALDQGKQIFMVLDAGMQKIGKKGGEVRNFFTFTEGKDGGHGLSILFTPVKTVCENTLRIALKQAFVTVNISHRGKVEAELQWRVDLLKKLQDVIGTVTASFDLMARAVLTEKQSRRVIDAAYPYPAKPAKVELKDDLDAAERKRAGILLDRVDGIESDWEIAKKRAEERRTMVWELFSGTHDTMRGMEGTAWGAYNAVVEVEDYRKEERGEDALVSALFGARARRKIRAFAEAYELAQVVVR